MKKNNVTMSGPLACGLFDGRHSAAQNALVLGAEREKARHTETSLSPLTHKFRQSTIYYVGGFPD